jgi:hypothetical protein
MVQVFKARGHVRVAKALEARYLCMCLLLRQLLISQDNKDVLLLFLEGICLHFRIKHTLSVLKASI